MCTRAHPHLATASLQNGDDELAVEQLLFLHNFFAPNGPVPGGSMPGGSMLVGPCLVAPCLVRLFVSCTTQPTLKATPSARTGDARDGEEAQLELVPTRHW
jgi:hypothetical protein